MDAAVPDVARWRFSTDALPERERRAAVHALYGRHTVMALEALPDVPVYVDFTHRRLPGLDLFTGTGGPVRTERTRRHLADGIVDLRLFVNLGRGLIWFGRGREVILHPGDAVLTSCAEPAANHPIVPLEKGPFFSLLLPQAAIAPLVTNLDDAVLRLIPPSTGALKLLVNYVGMLGDDEALATPDLCLIQGVPGTGKSRVIAEVVRQATLRGERVLLLAPSAPALDRVLERLGCRENLCPVRLLAPAESPEALEAIRVKVLGRRGMLTLAMRGLGSLDPEARRTTGAELNAAKDTITTALAEATERLGRAALEAQLAAERADVSLPVRFADGGRIHPISQTIDEIVAIFGEMGFTVAEGPHIEEDSTTSRR